MAEEELSRKSTLGRKTKIPEGSVCLPWCWPLFSGSEGISPSEKNINLPESVITHCSTTAAFSSGIVSLQSRVSRGSEQIPFLPVPHWAGHGWRMDSPRIPDQALYGEGTPSRQGRRKSIKAALKPDFKQWGQAAGSRETSSRQAGLAAAITECRGGCFLSSGVSFGLRSPSLKQPPYQHNCNCNSKAVSMYSGLYSASLVFPPHLGSQITIPISSIIFKCVRNISINIANIPFLGIQIQWQDLCREDNNLW